MSHVYFIQAGTDGPVKIGFTHDIAKRIHQLSTGNAAELKLLWSLDCEDVATAKNYEAGFHKIFANLRQRGEWFAWHPDIATLIGKLQQVVETFKGRDAGASFDIVRNAEGVHFRSRSIQQESAAT